MQTCIFGARFACIMKRAMKGWEGNTEMEIYNGHPALTKYQLLTTNGENKIVIKVPLSLKKLKQTCK